MSVLQGNFHQGDTIKFPEFGGRQCSANAVAAACKACILKPQLWVPSIIDECLLAGNNLFSKSFEMSPPHIQAHELYLRVDELLPSITFQDGIQVSKTKNKQ